jgi:hypothetical protein
MVYTALRFRISSKAKPSLALLYLSGPRKIFSAVVPSYEPSAADILILTSGQSSPPKASWSLAHSTSEYFA